MKVAQHGTYAGYIRHRRSQEPACEPCIFARIDYSRSWRIRNNKIATISITPAVLGLLLSQDPDALRQAVAELGQRTVDAAMELSARSTERVA